MKAKEQLSNTRVFHIKEQDLKESLELPGMQIKDIRPLVIRFPGTGQRKEDQVWVIEIQE